MLQILENRALEIEGGIYALWFSSINLGFKSLNDISQTSNSTIFFYENQARKGGGLYFGSDSIVHVYGNAFPCLNAVNFVKNSADYGGAVYVFARTTSETQYQDYSHPECFFQSLQCKKQDKPFYFSLNRANYSGISLYKSAFNNCSMGGRSFGEFELLNLMSNI